MLTLRSLLPRPLDSTLKMMVVFLVILASSASGSNMVLSIKEGKKKVGVIIVI